MIQEEKELLQQAISTLKLLDIRLSGSQFKQFSDWQIENVAKEKVTQQTMQGVAFKTGIEKIDEDEQKLAQILVSLGVRLVGEPESDEDEPPVFLFIEANFTVEYIIQQELTNEALKIFAENNAVHNVWPFWRQHVYDIVQRAGLPHIDIPFYTTVRLNYQINSIG